MATMVCRGHNSRLDSQFIEPTWASTRMPHINLTHPLEFALKSCFILCDSSPQKSPKPREDQYAHPRSSLSERSLALCTENLGNETGVDFVGHGAFADRTVEAPPAARRVKPLPVSREFPPPLTTISGVDSIVVRSHREDGRLVMEAVRAPARHSYFHVERSHGRLRLSVANVEFESEEEYETRNDDVAEEIDEDYEREYGKVVGAEMEIEKIERPCNCRYKEGESMENSNGRMMKWEAVWVASS